MASLGPLHMNPELVDAFLALEGIAKGIVLFIIQ